jgi:hypothetical protein
LKSQLAGRWLRPILSVEPLRAWTGEESPWANPGNTPGVDHGLVVPGQTKQMLRQKQRQIPFAAKQQFALVWIVRQNVSTRRPLND